MMRRYQSFSLHAAIDRVSRVVTAITAGVTAAALPLTVLGVGTVGAVIFRISDWSARTMTPASLVVSASDLPAPSTALLPEAAATETSAQTEPTKQASGGKEDEKAAQTDADQKNEAQAEESDNESVFELYTCTKSYININLYEKLGYEIFKTEKGDRDLSFAYLRKTVRT